jgi:pimeloyl-ACP methyl ester carboxylesterase
LEAATKSWPAWRKVHDDRRIMEIVDQVRDIFSTNAPDITLAGHSGGGSLIFGYLNAMPSIPTEVKRIAFLDSDYAYDTAKHADKIKNWLTASPQNHLFILAYQDYLARFNGKPFVSEAGGTWGRSRLMLDDLDGQFQFNSRTNDGLETYSIPNGQIEFLLKENPEGKILHTVQVERNGFIQALLSGTPAEGQNYEYLGPRAYTNWIQP